MFPRRWEGWNACRVASCPRAAFPLRRPFAGLSILGGILSDGMNDAGLSAGVLWIDDTAASYNYRLAWLDALLVHMPCAAGRWGRPPASVWCRARPHRQQTGAPLPPRTCCRSDDGRQALGFPDVVPYLLANFETVQQAVDFLDPAQLQVQGQPGGMVGRALARGGPAAGGQAATAGAGGRRRWCTLMHVCAACMSRPPPRQITTDFGDESSDALFVALGMEPGKVCWGGWPGLVCSSLRGASGVPALPRPWLPPWGAVRLAIWCLPAARRCPSTSA